MMQLLTRNDRIYAEYVAVGSQAIRVGVTSVLRGIRDSAITHVKSAIGKATGQVNSVCYEKLGIDLSTV